MAEAALLDLAECNTISNKQQCTAVIQSTILPSRSSSTHFPITSHQITNLITSNSLENSQKRAKKPSDAENNLVLCSIQVLHHCSNGFVFPMQHSNCADHASEVTGVTQAGYDVVTWVQHPGLHHCSNGFVFPMQHSNRADHDSEVTGCYTGSMSMMLLLGYSIQVYITALMGLCFQCNTLK